eukprot:6049602-Alexandrium_andersonii.AAC.1
MKWGKNVWRVPGSKALRQVPFLVDDSGHAPRAGTCAGYGVGLPYRALPISRAERVFAKQANGV